MSRNWKVGIVKDTSQPMLGLHGLHAAFRGLPGVEVVAHVDSNEEDLQQKLSFTQARRHYPTLAGMLENEDLDMVVLCSRHPYDHLEQVRAVAERGCHIYCEKPLSVTLRDADQIVELVERHGITFCMGHLSRYSLSYRTMGKLVADGAIGTPLTVYGRGKCDHRGGGEDLIVLGTHILDLEAFFFGEPEHVFADVTTGGRSIGKSDRCDTVEPIGPAAGDHVFAAFRFPGDVRGIFESRRSLVGAGCPTTPMGITVMGTEGSLSMRFADTNDAVLRINRRPGPPEDASSYEEVALVEERVIPGAEPLDYSLCGQRDIPGAKRFLENNRWAVWDLICAIEEGRRPVSNVYSARLVVEMIQGIYASAVSGTRVSFPLADRSHPLGE